MESLTAEQTRHVESALKTGNYLGKNSSVYAGNKSCERLVGTLFTYNKLIEPLSVTKSIRGVPVTTEKRDLKRIVADLGGTICASATDYALKTGDAVLYSAVNFTATSIYYLRDAAIITCAARITGAVSPLLALPAFTDNYPVTSKDLDTLTKDAEEFNNNIGSAGIVDINSRLASSEIDELLKKIRAIIRRLLRASDCYKKSNPKFVQGLYDASLINNSGSRHSGIKGILTSSLTGTPVEGATLVIKGKKYAKETVTGGYGEFAIQKFTPGRAKLIISAPGYANLLMDILIVRGKTEDMNLTLFSAALEMNKTVAS